MPSVPICCGRGGQTAGDLAPAARAGAVVTPSSAAAAETRTADAMASAVAAVGGLRGEAPARAAGALDAPTGAMGRKPSFKGEGEFLGRGVSYCATCDGAFYRDSEVAVIGVSQEAVEDEHARASAQTSSTFPPQFHRCS